MKHTCIPLGLSLIALSACSADRSAAAAGTEARPEAAAPTGGAEARSAAPTGGTEAAPEARSAAPAASDGPTIDVSGMPLVPGATAEVSDTRIVVKLPTSECIHTTISPLVIGDQIIFGTHKRTGRGPYVRCKEDPTEAAMYAVSAVDGSARLLVPGADAEATPVFAEGGILMPLVGGGGGIASWHSGTGTILKPLRAGMDSAPLWDPIAEQLVVGTINAPSPMCNSERRTNPNCGILMALSRDGTITKKADLSSGFRAWVVAGPTTDGERYYVGGGSGKSGRSEAPGTGSCEVLKLDRDLNVVQRYDDGLPGCRDVGMLKSAPIGEIPVVGGRAYAQYLGATQDGVSHVPFVILDTATMQPVCRATISAPGQRSLTGFYIGPVVDERGSAYIVTHTSRGRALVRIDADCKDEILATSKTDTFSSPTLADDRYVLVADAGTLHVLDRDTGRGERFSLGSAAEVVGGVAVSEYGVIAVSADGTVTILKDTGVGSYGAAPWPRFRKDNLGGGGAY